MGSNLRRALITEKQQDEAYREWLAVVGKDKDCQNGA